MLMFRCLLYGVNPPLTNGPVGAAAPSPEFISFAAHECALSLTESGRLYSVCLAGVRSQRSAFNRESCLGFRVVYTSVALCCLAAAAFVLLYISCAVCISV